MAELCPIRNRVSWLSFQNSAQLRTVSGSSRRGFATRVELHDTHSLLFCQSRDLLGRSEERELKGIFLACALTLLSAPAIGQEMRIESSPKIGAEAVVPAGEAIYSYARVYTIDGAQLKAGSGPGSYLRGRSVAAGTELVPVPTKSAYKACVPAPGTLDPDGPCFMDDDGDGQFDRQATNGYNMAQRLKEPVPYSRVPISLTREDSFKRLILFQGATSDSLRFSYREFDNDLARPAFTEDLTIPREQFPAMIRIKNLQIEVLGVTGMGLRYRVVRVD